ncbi:MAG: hypothetical protein ACYC64_07545 [Armatimonadota bacterium]
MRMTFFLALSICAISMGSCCAAGKTVVPPSWEILPIPRYVNYGSPKSFVTLGRVAIVRKEGGPYQTLRTNSGELIGESTITEEDLARALRNSGVAQVDSVADNLSSYDGYDTLMLLGNPEYNAQTAKMFKKMKLSFSTWDATDTPEDDFADWNDFGREGYLLKVGKVGGKNIVILAGYDHNDANGAFYGAGTFYALQSLRQLIVRDRDAIKIKTVEIADKPLVAVRGYYTAFIPSEDYQWRDIDMMAKMKVNANVYWYGNSMAGYSAEATSKFRYPWRPEQLETFGKIGKWCKEHFITMVFCMNADHYTSWWATPMSFDGKRKDPCHYDPGYQIESEFTQMWAKLGYEVKNDVDALASKFVQLNKAVGGEAIFQPMNEDDVFGLIHSEDKKFFNTDTADKKQDAINYGRARGLLLASLYKRVRELCPDSSLMMPMDPPSSLPYQRVLETNEDYSRDFLKSMVETFKEQGVFEHIPVLTTAGGTLAEVIINKQIDDFKDWCDGAPVLLHENNIATDHMGAYETNPKGRRSFMQLCDSRGPEGGDNDISQRLSRQYPAGYRDKNLYKRLWGIEWNGMNVYDRAGQYVVAWSMAQWMWNMAALDRDKINAMAVRKVSSAESYPLVKDFFEEFNRPMGYLPDETNPNPPLIISNRIAFQGTGWNYIIEPSNDMRVECQRLRAKLAKLLPELDAKWRNDVEKIPAFKWFGYKALNFCTVYLAQGYINGWNCEKTTAADILQGERLRDLYLDAEDIQQRFFAGPEIATGRNWVCHNNYHDPLRSLYTGERLGPYPKTSADAKHYADFWQQGLLNRFFEPVLSISTAELTDGDARLAGGWGKVEEADGEKFRTITGEAALSMKAIGKDRLLVRARVGAVSAANPESSEITLASGSASRHDSVFKTRWVTWLLPRGVSISTLTIKAEKPVRVCAVEVYCEMDSARETKGGR